MDLDDVLQSSPPNSEKRGKRGPKGSDDDDDFAGPPVDSGKDEESDGSTGPVDPRELETHEARAKAQGTQFKSKYLSNSVNTSASKTPNSALKTVSSVRKIANSRRGARGRTNKVKVLETELQSETVDSVVPFHSPESALQYAEESLKFASQTRQHNANGDNQQSSSTNPQQLREFHNSIHQASLLMEYDSKASSRAPQWPILFDRSHNTLTRRNRSPSPAPIDPSCSMAVLEMEGNSPKAFRMVLEIKELVHTLRTTSPCI